MVDSVLIPTEDTDEHSAKDQAQQIVEKLES